jgi:hypothetical protein
MHANISSFKNVIIFKLYLYYTFKIIIYYEIKLNKKK